MDIRRTVNMAPGVYVIDGGTLSVNSTATGQRHRRDLLSHQRRDAVMNGGADIT